jgi:phytoene dehydrogenase-like protein
VTRVLVIGAGHTGLVAAIELAAHGLDVTVLEHQAQPGGASRSVIHDGFIHDHCAAFAPMAVASPAMQELGLEREGLEWVNPDVVVTHPFPDGTSIALHRDVGATLDSLGTAAPGWAAAMEQMLPVADSLVEAVLSPLPPVRAPARLALALRRDGMEWVRRLAGSVEALGLDLFEGDRRATAWLAGSAQHSGLPPTTAASGAFGFLLQIIAHSHGWPLARGGMQAFADALVARAQREGATISCGRTVEEILVRRGRVAGVRLAGGETVAADAVVSTVSAGLLARLIPDGALPARVHRRLRIWRYGTAPFKLDYGLSGPMPWVAENARRSAVVHIAGWLEDLTRAADDAQRGETPERPSMVVGQQSLYDPTRAPAGKHNLYVYSHVPSRRELPDEAVASRIEAQLERFAPGFSELVEHRLMRTPEETEAENPSLVGGDLAGGSYELDQQLIFRPTPQMSRYHSPIRGLYVGGASTHPGGAVHGMTGRGAARALLRDHRLRRV